MTEEEMEKREVRLREEIDLLKFTLGVTLATLPENHRDYVLARVAERVRHSRHAADTRDTDPLRDQAETAYEFEQDMIHRLEEDVDTFADRLQFYGIP